jgi:outer membrane murein-binding lipoprotein Lpp
MELVYSTQNSDFDPEKRYRNPAHFDRPEAGVTHAVVIGDWPKVVDAYEALGVEVSVTKPLFSEPVDLGGAAVISGLEQNNATLRAERDGILRLIEAAEGLSELEHPGAGELPIRLYDALKAIHEGVVTLEGERDNLASEVQSLNADIERLKAAVNQPDENAEKIAALKAQLDAAKVQYRANASVESLEKAVADLQQA